MNIRVADLGTIGSVHPDGSPDLSVALDVLDPAEGARVHGDVTVVVPAHSSMEVDVLDARPTDERLQRSSGPLPIARELGRIGGLECRVEGGDESDAGAVDRGDLHHLRQGTILP